MKISDNGVKLINDYSLRQTDTKIHPEDATVYNSGLQDGITIFAQALLQELIEEKESD